MNVRYRKQAAKYSLLWTPVTVVRVPEPAFVGSIGFSFFAAYSGSIFPSDEPVSGKKHSSLKEVNSMQPIVELLAEVPLFEDFDPEELQSVARLCKKKTFPKGAILFLEGDVGDKLYLIQSGLVKISRQEQNREITLALFRDGDFFGEMSLIEKNSLRSATAETIEPSVLYVLLRQDFIHFLENSPKLCLRLLEIAYSRLRKANDQIHDLTFLDVRGRIAKNLVRLADEYGVPGPAGTQIDIKLTHQQIANMSGTVRETVTKTLHELQEEGVIDIDKKKIRILDPRRLQELIRY